MNEEGLRNAMHIEANCHMGFLHMCSYCGRIPQQQSYRFDTVYFPQNSFEYKRTCWVSHAASTTLVSPIYCCRASHRKSFLLISTSCFTLFHFYAFFTFAQNLQLMYSLHALQANFNWYYGPLIGQCTKIGRNLTKSLCVIFKLNK